MTRMLWFKALFHTFSAKGEHCESLLHDACMYREPVIRELTCRSCQPYETIESDTTSTKAQSQKLRIESVTS